MSYKRKGIWFFVAIVILILGVFLSIYLYMGAGKKEIKAAKYFMADVYYHDIVIKSGSINDFKFKSVAKNGANSSNEYYSVVTNNYGIEVNDSYEVIGFTNKASESGDVNISKDKAKGLAEDYLGYIYDGEYEFKEFMNSDEELTYYPLVFTKYEDGYPYYVDQIMIGINKTNGKLDKYSNGTFQGKPKKNHINVNKEEAEKIAMNVFKEIYDSGVVVEESYEAYCDNKDSSETELCYVVTINGEDENKNSVKFRYFITTDKGEIINMIKVTVSETVA